MIIAGLMIDTLGVVDVKDVRDPLSYVLSGEAATLGFG